MLVAIVLASTVILSIAGGMLTMMKVSRHAEERQRVSLALTSFTESIKAIDYLDCGRADDGNGTVDLGEYDYAAFPNAVTAADLGVDTAKIVGIEYWNGVDSFVALNASSCVGSDVTPAPNPVPPDPGAQRVTVEVTYRDVTSRASIVKRQP